MFTADVQKNYLHISYFDFAGLLVCFSPKKKLDLLIFDYINSLKGAMSTSKGPDFSNMLTKAKGSLHKKYLEIF